MTQSDVGMEMRIETKVRSHIFDVEMFAFIASRFKWYACCWHLTEVFFADFYMIWVTYASNIAQYMTAT